MKTLRIKIATPPPTLNVMLRKHHMSRSRINNRIYTEVMAEVRSQVQKKDLPLFGGAPVRITGTRYSNSPLDPDNLIGSLKPVIDGLRHCGAILDDTENHVTIGKIRQIKLRGRVSKLVICIERLDP